MNNLQLYSPENSTIPYHNLLTGSSRGYSGEFVGDIQQLRRVHFISLQARVEGLVKVLRIFNEGVNDMEVRFKVLLAVF